MSKKDIYHRIALWNYKRGLLDKNSYNLNNGFNMLLEEVLELKTNDKELIKEIINDVNNRVGSCKVSFRNISDAFKDIIYIAIGEDSKYIEFMNAHLDKNITIDDIALIIKAGLNRVIEANDKKGLGRNEQGKIIKSKDFVEPVIPLTLDELTIEERKGCCCKEEYDDAGEIK